MPGPFTGNPLAGSFGYFQAAVNDPQVRSQPGGVQQFVWAAVRQDFLSRGEPLPANAFASVNQLLSLAGQQRRAAQDLSQALSRQESGPFDVAVSSSFTAPHLDTRALNDMLTGPQHRMVYLTQELVEGEPILSYRTHDFGYDLPQTVRALADVAESAAQVSAADYGYEWAGVATPVALYTY